MLPIQILAPPEPDIAIDAKAACAFRDLVDDAERYARDHFEARGFFRGDLAQGHRDVALNAMAAILKSLSHRPVTQYYEAEIVRLRELVKQQELTIQALGKAVAERETAGAR
jgi:hypothetical protein